MKQADRKGSKGAKEGRRSDSVNAELENSAHREAFKRGYADAFGGLSHVDPARMNAALDSFEQRLAGGKTGKGVTKCRKFAVADQVRKGDVAMIIGDPFGCNKTGEMVVIIDDPRDGSIVDQNGRELLSRRLISESCDAQPCPNRNHKTGYPTAWHIRIPPFDELEEIFGGDVRKRRIRS